MIPWETFKTPQDAYEWAKKNASRLYIFWNPYTFEVWVIVGGSCLYPTNCVLRVRR
jgi:hypothetical protein